MQEMTRTLPRRLSRSAIQAGREAMMICLPITISDEAGVAAMDGVIAEIAAKS